MTAILHATICWSIFPAAGMLELKCWLMLMKNGACKLQSFKTYCLLWLFIAICSTILDINGISQTKYCLSLLNIECWCIAFWSAHLMHFDSGYPCTFLQCCFTSHWHCLKAQNDFYLTIDPFEHMLHGICSVLTSYMLDFLLRLHAR